MKNLLDMDNKKQLDELREKEKPEIVLDFTNNKNGEIHIEIIKIKNYQKKGKN